MYLLMKSQKFTLDHLVSGLMSSYRQTEIGHFQKFRAALGACEVANKDGARYYVLNESGKEYYDGTWID